MFLNFCIYIMMRIKIYRILYGNGRNEVAMSKEKGLFVGKLLAIILTVSVVLVFISIGLFGFIGVVKVVSYFDLIYVNLYPTKFSNALYFGWFFIFIFIVLIFIEIFVRMLMKLGNITQSLMKNIISYSIQILIGII